MLTARALKLPALATLEATVKSSTLLAALLMLRARCSDARATVMDVLATVQAAAMLALAQVPSVRLRLLITCATVTDALALLLRARADLMLPTPLPSVSALVPSASSVMVRTAAALMAFAIATVLNVRLLFPAVLPAKVMTAHAVPRLIHALALPALDNQLTA